MKWFFGLVAVVLVVGVSGIGGVQAQSSASPKAPSSRCLFPSGRTLGAVISEEAKKAYLAQGYKQVLVGVRVVVKRPVVTTLTKGSVTGLTSVTPTAGNPTMLRISANIGGAPLELGCNTEAEITTTVGLTDAAGLRSSGRSVTKVTVQGALQ